MSTRTPRARLVLPFVSLLVALAGCGAAGSSPQTHVSQPVPTIRPKILTPTPTTAPPTSSSPTPAVAGGPRCPEPAPGTSVRTVSVAGISRSYLLSIPAQEGPRPVVIDYHGYQQSARQQDAYTGLSVEGTPEGFVVLTPEGYGGRWNFVRRAAVGPDDVAFAQAMLSDAATHACLDQHRVGATGMSDGADMADTLACALPGRIAAVAPVAPSVFPLTGCNAAVNYLEIHGTADPIVPYAGGGGDRPPPFQGTEAQSVPSRLAQWGRLSACSNGTTSTLAAGVTAMQLACPAGHQVELLSISGGGHTWPGAVGPPPAAGLGVTSTAINADQVVLHFLAAHNT